MDLDLKGKIALITGSTAGIGLAIAERLAAEGARTIICGRDPSRLDEAARQVARMGDVEAVLADPATAQGAAALIAAVPRVDILVNNLGIYEAKPFAEISDEDWLHMFDVNVLSGARLARHYFPAMLAQSSGRVIFVASESALLIPPEMVHYGMSKSAQLGLARGMAELTRGTGVTVNSIMPGPTRSAGIRDFIASVVTDEGLTGAEREVQFFERFRPLSLIRRLIEPAEIAAQVALLVSPLGGITNGAAIRVEGGMVPTIA
jgi:NAD(P)-dependent dehydrogenase (short-subunit alcohol dehydrogenase family)